MSNDSVWVWEWNLSELSKFQEFVWVAGKTGVEKLLSNWIGTLRSLCKAGNAIDLRLARVGESVSDISICLSGLKSMKKTGRSTEDLLVQWSLNF